MKKFLTLVLALVLVFGLSVPAMAFTSDTTDADENIPYDLSVYLVEYDNDDFFGITTLPASDRGYAKNEIVAAIVELYVPSGEDPFDDGYDTLNIGGDNVSFDVADAWVASDVTLPLVDKAKPADGFTLTLANDDLKGKDTFRWLVFAKVTDDDASITAKLVDGGAAGADFVSPYLFTLSGVDYEVTKVADGTNWIYTIEALTGDYTDDQIIINVDKNYKTKGMSIDLDGGAALDPANDEIALGVNTDGELGWVDGAIVKTSGATFDSVMDVYEDIAVDVFGMDYFNIGNYLRDSFFEDLVSSDTIVATVDIEPWTAYVTVPDNIVVDPPKTGDAASIMGFVMVALSGAGAVALKKRG